MSDQNVQCQTFIPFRNRIWYKLLSLNLHLTSCTQSQAKYFVKVMSE